MDQNIEGTTLQQEINNVRAITQEIKAHVIEGLPQSTGLGQAVNPKAAHKIMNLKDDLRQIQRELEEILKSVQYL
jgi:hypothetical protein